MEPTTALEEAQEIKPEPEVDKMDDGFVMVELDENYKFAASFYQQMEEFLLKQIDKCDYWKKYFEKQNNPSMANKFEAYSTNTTQNLDLLRLAMKNNESVPKYKFEHVCFNCLPTNVDVRDKEVQLSIKALNLPVEKGALVYIIAEFAYPHPKDETILNSLSRWAYYVNIDSRNIVSCCSSSESKQMDMVHSVDTVPFHNPDIKQMEFCRPISFFIEKPKSRSMRRKFRQIKLTFYEKTRFLTCDKKIGTVQLKIDDINDEITVLSRQNVMDGRKQTDGLVDIKIRVRQALVNRAIRAHEERLLLLT